MTETLDIPPQAAKTQARDMRMEATLRIQHLQDNRDDLSLMLKALREMADAEPDAGLNMALELAALEIGRLADRYNDEHQRLMWTASLALEGK